MSDENKVVPIKPKKVKRFLMTCGCESYLIAEATIEDGLTIISGLYCPECGDRTPIDCGMIDDE